MVRVKLGFQNRKAQKQPGRNGIFLNERNGFILPILAINCWDSLGIVCKRQ